MNERSIFLFDGLGATLSFIFSGFILPYFSDVIGLSKQVIYCLAVFPAIYMIFSFSCYRFVAVIKSWMLLTIILANMTYVLISGGLIVFHVGLSDWGKYLLSAEILVLLGVITLEIKVYQKHFRN